MKRFAAFDAEDHEKYIQVFVPAVDELNLHYKEIRDARKELFKWDVLMPNWLSYEIDLGLSRCDDPVDWSCNQSHLGPEEGHFNYTDDSDNGEDFRSIQGSDDDHDSENNHGSDDDGDGSDGSSESGSESNMSGSEDDDLEGDDNSESDREVGIDDEGHDGEGSSGQSADPSSELPVEHATQDGEEDHALIDRSHESPSVTVGESGQ